MNKYDYMKINATVLIFNASLLKGKLKLYISLGDIIGIWKESNIKSIE